MTVFRCTARLAKRLRVGLASDALPSSGTLGDWYANSLNVGSARYVLCLSSLTRLPVILPGRKSEFPNRFPDYLGEILRAIGISASAADLEVKDLSPFTFAKTRDRSLIGSLNDFASCGSVHLTQGDSPFEASLRLAEMPVNAIGFVYPAEAARAAFASRSSG